MLERTIRVKDVVRLLLVWLFCHAVFIIADDLTITTYYPSPYGVYNQLRTRGNTFLATDAVGNVGVGTPTPAAKLDVVGNTATTWNNLLRLRNTNNDGAGVLLDAQDRDWAIVATNPPSGFGNEKLVFYDATAGFPAGGRMVIDSNGRIGLGTTNPQSSLHVYEGGSATARLILESLWAGNGAIANQIDFRAPSSPATPNDKSFQIININPSGSITKNRFVIRPIDDAGNPTSGRSIVLTHDGNVGIGTGSPSAKLDVNGSLGFTGQKICVVVNTGDWHEAMLVPQGWREITCSNWAASPTVLANKYHIGCIFEDGYSVGTRGDATTTNGGDPDPNCGW